MPRASRTATRHTVTSHFHLILDIGGNRYMAWAPEPSKGRCPERHISRLIPHKEKKHRKEKNHE